MRKVKIAIIGCGNISDIYMKNLTEMFTVFDVVGCGDIDLEKAKNQAEKYGIPFMTVEEILSNTSIELVLNITTPNAHKEVCEAVLKSGKHVYVEKPLSLTREDGECLVKLAKEKGVKLGCAPDTFLGAGIQTARKLIDDGWIGKPIAATAFLTNHGHESWHPSPEFYYQKGGGPMLDMGPYYITALINLLGPVKQVTGATKMSFDKRKITSEPKFGKVIEVEVPTHVTGIMNFVNGAIGTIITSFDIWGANLPRIEIHGTKGSISVPDPNTFGGEIMIKMSNDKAFHAIPLTHGFAENSRGLGLADMAYSIINDSEHRANGELANHVLDIMIGFHDASDQEKHITLGSTCKQPRALPFGISVNNIDELMNGLED